MAIGAPNFGSVELRAEEQLAASAEFLCAFRFEMMTGDEFEEDEAEA